MDKDRKIVLVADADSPSRQTLCSHLNRIGHTSLEAADGLETLQLMSDNRIDLLILDLNLPKINGYTILQLCIDKNFDLPIVIYSSSINCPQKVEFIHAKKQYPYIEKPLSFEKTIELCGKYLADKLPPDKPV